MLLKGRNRMFLSGISSNKAHIQCVLNYIKRHDYCRNQILITWVIHKWVTLFTTSVASVWWIKHQSGDVVRSSQKFETEESLRSPSPSLGYSATLPCNLVLHCFLSQIQNISCNRVFTTSFWIFYTVRFQCWERGPGSAASSCCVTLPQNNRIQGWKRQRSSGPFLCLQANSIIIKTCLKNACAACTERSQPLLASHTRPCLLLVLSSFPNAYMFPVAFHAHCISFSPKETWIMFTTFSFFFAIFLYKICFSL